MEPKDFSELVERARAAGAKGPLRVALVAADDAHALEGVLRARAEGIAEPILIGVRARIEAAYAVALETAPAGAERPAGRSSGAASGGGGARTPEIAEAPDEAAAAAAGVSLVARGEADFLMKGRLQTAELMRAVVAKGSGLRTGRLMSHIAVFQVPRLGRLLWMTDGGMATRPDLAQKREILENAVGAMLRLGYARPKVAVLAAAETPSDKMPESMDGAALKAMWAEGSIKDCVVEGPISYDLAMSEEAAAIKGYASPVAGAAELLIVPDIAAGNILGKCLTLSAGATMAGIVAGAAAPIVLVSRGATSEEKYLSIALAAAIAGGGGAS